MVMFTSYLTRTIGILVILGLIALTLQITSLVRRVSGPGGPGRVPKLSDYTYVERSFPF